MTTGLTEQTIREFKWRDRWIGRDDDLSIDFIREMRDYLDWEDCISVHQKLSQKEIEEFKDYVNWQNIIINQEISYDFMEKHVDKINWGLAACRFQDDPEFKRRFEYYVELFYGIRIKGTYE